MKTQPDGVFEHEAYDDRSFTEPQLHHDSKEGFFGEEALRVQSSQLVSCPRSGTVLAGLVAPHRVRTCHTGIDSKDAATGQGSGTKRPQKPAARQIALRAKVLLKRTFLFCSKVQGQARAQHPQRKLAGPRKSGSHRQKLLRGTSSKAGQPLQQSQGRLRTIASKKKEKAADELPPDMPYGMVPYTEPPAGMQLWPVDC